MSKNQFTKTNLAWLIVIIGSFLLINVLISVGVINKVYQTVMLTIGINIILAISLNLIVGITGQFSLGHAGFMSVGAYVGCIFTVNMNLPVYIEFPIAVLLGGLVAALFGVIIGVPALRLKGDYLAIVTLAFGEIILATFSKGV